MIMFIIVYGIMPIAQVFVSEVLTTYAYMLVIVFVLFYIVFAGGARSISYYFPILFPFLVYTMLTYFLNYDSLVLWGYRAVLFMVPPIIGFYIMNEKPKLEGKLAWLILALFIIAVITTLIGLIRFPFAARVLATIASSDNEEMIQYQWNNIGGYEFIYAVVLLYPILIYAYKRRKINLFFTLVIAVLIFVLLLYSEYATALLFFIVSSSLFFLPKDISNKGIIIFSSVCLVFVVLFSSVFSDILLWLSKQFQSETLAHRFEALAGGAEGIINSEDNRLELYQKSFNTFLQNPIFGCMLTRVSIIGGHSALLDTLANYGILGITLIIWMYRNFYLVFFKPYVKEKGGGFVLWIFIQIIIFSLINTGFFFTVMSLYAPLLLKLIASDKKDKLNNKKLARRGQSESFMDS